MKDYMFFRYIISEAISPGTLKSWLQNCCLDLVDDVVDVGVGNPGTCGEADADFEEGFRDAVDVGWCVFVDGLFVHRLPQRARFDAGGVKRQAQCLD